MITNQTNQYASLFAAANQALKITDPDAYITSLNEYFSVIEDLAQIDLKFTILPLNEEVFEIDANTRTITVPPSFKNGVGVKGDQVAEIIYFKIDRYFDATDLNTQNIYFEWENVKGEQGLSKEYVRDITSDPDHIIFGWPLDSRITEYAGKVKFAIRFYSFDNPEAENKKIIYSFGTQPQTILINNTMDFDITNDNIQDLGDDINNMIKTRFQNSEKDNVDDADVPAPKFTVNLTTGEYDVDPTSNKYVFKAQAVGSGNITYILKRAEIGSAVWVNQDGSNIKIEYIQTTDTERNPDKIYYKKTENPVAYEVFTDNFSSETNGGIYEQYCSATISASGNYVIQAKNRVGLSSKTLDSNTVTFPKPVKPIVKTGPIPVILNDGKADLNIEFIEPCPDKGKMIYKWEDAKSVIANNTTKCSIATDEEESYYYATAINERNAEQLSSDKITYRVTKPAQTPVIIEPTVDTTAYINNPISVKVKIDNVPYDSITVQWYEEKGNTDIVCGEPIEVDSNGIASYTPTKNGQYYAKVTLERNGNTAIATTKLWNVFDN